MQITDITNSKIENLIPGKLIDLARENVVVMTFTQFQKIIKRRTDNETYLAVHSVLNETTYLGFFRDPENKEVFYLSIYTGKKIPYELATEWIQIRDLRIATTSTANLPWTVFCTSRHLTKSETTFVQDFFTFITRSYTNKNITVYGLVPRTEKIETISDEMAWYWIFSNVIGIIEDVDGVNVPIATLMPMPGANDTVLLVDRMHHTHQFTFVTDKLELVKLDAPRMVL